MVYCPTHIYRKGWLTNRLSLSIILNLVLESSVVRTLLLISLLAAGLLSPSPKWTLLLLPPTPPHQNGGAAQPATQKMLPLVPSPTSSSSPNLQSRTMTLSPMFLSFLFTSWGQRLLILLHCPTLIKWSHWNLRPPTIFIGECRWSHIFLVNVFSTLLMAHCRVLPLMILTVWMVFLRQSTPLFSIGSHRISLF